MADFCALPCVHVDVCVCVFVCVCVCVCVYVCVCGMCDVVTVIYFKIIYLKYLGLPL